MFKRKRNPEGAAMRARLTELRQKYRSQPAALMCLEGYQIYADVGKDRKKIGMEWAERAEKSCEEAIAFDAMLRDAFPRNDKVS